MRGLICNGASLDLSLPWLMYRFSVAGFCRVCRDAVRGFIEPAEPESVEGTVGAELSAEVREEMEVDLFMEEVLVDTDRVGFDLVVTPAVAARSGRSERSETRSVPALVVGARSERSEARSRSRSVVVVEVLEVAPRSKEPPMALPELLWRL